MLIEVDKKVLYIYTLMNDKLLSLITHDVILPFVYDGCLVNQCLGYSSYCEVIPSLKSCQILFRSDLFLNFQYLSN